MRALPHEVREFTRMYAPLAFGVGIAHGRVACRSAGGYMRARLLFAMLLAITIVGCRREFTTQIPAPPESIVIESARRPPLPRRLRSGRRLPRRVPVFLDHPVLYAQQVERVELVSLRRIGRVFALPFLHEKDQVAAG